MQSLAGLASHVRDLSGAPKKVHVCVWMCELAWTHIGRVSRVEELQIQTVSMTNLGANLGGLTPSLSDTQKSLSLSESVSQSAP